MWTPFSRLTFSVYLVHVPVIDIFMRSLQYPKYVDKTNIFVDFLAMTFVSYFVAVLFSIVIEIPVKTLLLMGFNKKSSKDNYYEIND